MDLIYDMLEAGFEHKIMDHPQTVMRSLGISWLYAIPQSIADQWWFLRCAGAPSQLPSYLREMTPESARRAWNAEIESVARAAAATKEK